MEDTFGRLPDEVIDQIVKIIELKPQISFKILAYDTSDYRPCIIIKSFYITNTFVLPKLGRKYPRGHKTTARTNIKILKEYFGNPKSQLILLGNRGEEIDDHTYRDDIQFSFQETEIYIFHYNNDTSIPLSLKEPLFDALKEYQHYLEDALRK